jgi:membrane protease subunit (stomatin/prohibitin family)
VQQSKHPADDAITRIEKLAGLLEKGLITQAEFDDKKAKLLEEI